MEDKEKNPVRVERPAHVQDIRKKHFPDGVPALKWKKGTYYRPNNCGYTTSLLEAGLYTKEDVISDGFAPGKDLNGYYGVYAMPLWMALEQGYWSKEKVGKYSERLRILAKYIEVEKVDTIIF